MYVPYVMCTPNLNAHLQIIELFSKNGNLKKKKWKNPSPFQFLTGANSSKIYSPNFGINGD